MAIVAGNELGERYAPIYFASIYGQIVGQTGLFNLGISSELGKSLIQTF